MSQTLTIGRILFPTDFSELSQEAGRAAAAFARHFQARLTVLYVVPPITDPTPAARLDAVVGELADGITVDGAVVAGVPARQIVKYADRHGVDLIVMGTHGRTGVTRRLLGSVAEGVVRHAPCRVLTVPARALTTRAGAAEEPERPSTCIVCREASSDLVCERCRARIRGEALDRPRRAEHPGHV
jgi:nucleotide-binding universal stress UspA family protein